MVGNKDNSVDVLPPEIVGLEDISAHPKLLVFAKSGAGKTVWLGSDPKTLIINCEAASQGELSAKRQGSKAKQWKVYKWEDWLKVTNWLKRLVEQGKSIPFDVIAVDGITKLQKIHLRHLVTEAHNQAPSKYDAIIPSQRAYYENQLTLQQEVLDLNALPVMVVWTALVRKETDPEGNDFLFPAIQGKGYEIAQAILADMTSFGYLFVKDRYREVNGKKKKIGKDRFIIWEDSGIMQGKDRTNVLAPFTKNKSLKEIREMIEQSNSDAVKEESKSSE